MLFGMLVASVHAFCECERLHAREEYAGNLRFVTGDGVVGIATNAGDSNASAVCIKQ